MTDPRHPSDETLARHAAGALAAGPAIVIEAHLRHCPYCRAAVDGFEAVGGVLLERLPPSQIPSDGLDRAFAAIERGGSRTARAAVGRKTRPDLPAGIEWPESLDDCEFGPWRLIAPGVRKSRAQAPWARASDMQLLRVAPGRSLLRHGHGGTEWTYILSGVYSDGRARFAAGDICEVDEDVDHQPVIEAGAECICLAAMEGRMRPRGMLGRFYQRFLDT